MASYAAFVFFHTVSYAYAVASFVSLTFCTFSYVFFVVFFVDAAFAFSASFFAVVVSVFVVALFCVVRPFGVSAAGYTNVAFDII